MLKSVLKNLPKLPSFQSKKTLHIEWYKDPHLLAKRISSLDPTTESAKIFDLVERHQGAANAVVFGNVINRFSKAGMSQESFQAYKMMRGRKIKPTLQTYTNLLFIKPNSQAVCREDNIQSFNQSLNVFEEMKKRKIVSVIHVNSLLNSCYMFKAFGGLSESIKIFESLPELNITPDVITFTAMFKILSYTDTNTDFIFQNKSLRNVLMDVTFLNTVLLYYSSINSKSILGFSKKAFGVPFLATCNEFDFLKEGLVPNIQSYDILLRQFLKTNDFVNADILIGYMKSQGQLLVDESVLKTITLLLVRAQKFNDALLFLDLVAHVVPKKYVVELKTLVFLSGARLGSKNSWGEKCALFIKGIDSSCISVTAMTNILNIYSKCLNTDLLETCLKTCRKQINLLKKSADSPELQVFKSTLARNLSLDKSSLKLISELKDLVKKF